MSFLTTKIICDAPKILHVSFHKGCIKELENVAKCLDWDLSSLYIHDLPPYEFDGKTKGNAIYNIGNERANNIWNKHKDYFNQFDVIITSDTGPLSRIFLQNQYNGKLIVWICNRFDYYDGASLDCDFPDRQYYDLLNKARLKPNVVFASYTEFERIYGLSKGIDFGDLYIKPCGFSWIIGVSRSGLLDTNQKKFLIPDYISNHNLKLVKICESLNIPAVCERYNGPDDLKKFKGIIHIPYSWSNLALFENLSNGLVHFIPSAKFMRTLVMQGSFWPNSNFIEKDLESSEWYNPDKKDLFVFFDSWQDLKNKIESVNIDEIKKRCINFSILHRQTMLDRWQKLIPLRDAILC